MKFEIETIKSYIEKNMAEQFLVPIFTTNEFNFVILEFFLNILELLNIHLLNPFF